MADREALTRENICSCLSNAELIQYIHASVMLILLRKQRASVKKSEKEKLLFYRFVSSFAFYSSGMCIYIFFVNSKFLLRRNISEFRTIAYLYCGISPAVRPLVGVNCGIN